MTTLHNNLYQLLVPVLLLLPCSAAECRTLPHIAHITVASVFSVVFILVGGLFALADVTPNPVSQNWLATAHAGVEVKTWVFKTAIVLCANVLTGFLKLQVTPILIFATWIAYVHVRWVSVMVPATAATSAFAVPCLILDKSPIAAMQRQLKWYHPFHLGSEELHAVAWHALSLPCSSRTVELPSQLSACVNCVPMQLQDLLAALVNITSTRISANAHQPDASLSS
jgi:hypothetical protein